MNKLYALFFFLFFIACENRQAIELPDTTPVLTANCFAEAGNTWRIYVSSSAPTDEFSGQFEAIENASVSISDSNSEILLNHTQEDIYESNESLIANEQYQLEINAPDYPDLTANLTVPYPPNVSNINFTVNEDNNNFLEFELEDLPNVDNYYFVEVKAIRINPGGWEDRQFIYFKENTPVIDFSIGNSNRSRLFFDDQIFQGSRIVLKFDTSTNINGYTDVVVTITHADENFYFYNKTAKQQSYNSENPFAEPSPIHSNIEGGFGIFAAYNSVTDTISIE